MYASTTTVNARPQGIDQGVRFVQDEVMPALQGIDGFVGLSTLVDHATGRCIITSSWHSKNAIRAAEPHVQPIRERCAAAFAGPDTAAEPVGGSVVVEDWEVALMHRAHRSDSAACARVSWLEGDPDTSSASVDAFRGSVRDMEQLPGFASASLLIDRMAGRAVATVAYESAAAMAKSRPQANQLRTRVADATGAYVIEVAEFELVLSELRVPELV